MKKSSGRKKFELNPAFANAHGLSEETGDPWENLDKELSVANSTASKLVRSIEEARKTGKLVLDGVEMTLPLPDQMFNLRNDLLKQYDGVMGSNDRLWSCYGEEMLTLLDLSNNDFSKDVQRDENDKDGLSTKPSLVALDDRIGCYRALRTLRLRNCNLDDLPWGTIGEHMIELTIIDAPGNRFTAVPLNQLPPSINSLLLADNKIQSLGESSDTIHLPALTHLDVTNNGLTHLPLELYGPNLRHLILAKNQIESIPSKFLESLQNSLHTLDLAENRLSSEIDVSLHSKLQVLELRNNRLTIAPKIHPNLSRVGLSFNLLTSIANLYDGQMDLNGKVLDDDEKWFRAKLCELHLSKNKLKNTLHELTLSSMTNLSVLDISRNDLENIPHVVGYLPLLNRIVLDGNPLRMIRSSIKYKANGSIETGALVKSLRNKGDAPSGPGYYGSAYEGAISESDAATPQSLVQARGIVRDACSGLDNTLKTSGQGISGKLLWTELINELHNEIKKQDGEVVTYGSLVKTWKFSNGKISSFGDEWVEALPNITTLEATRNMISEIPSSFSKLSLKTFEFGRNRLSSIVLRDTICVPKSMLASSLVNLDLSTNTIEWIPGSLFDLSSLVSLNLSHNQIKTLDWIVDDETGEGRGWKHGLVSLEYLNLSNNSISDLGYLPLALSGCKRLRTLLLNNNAIYDIPLEIGLLEQLTSIDLLGNSQRQIRVRVLTQSCGNILQYLRDRMTPEELQEAKENHREIQMDLEEDGDDSDDEANESRAGDDSKAETEIKEAEVGDSKSASTSLERHVEKTIDKEEEMPASDIISDLQQNIVQLSAELDNMSISQAKRFALKKQLAMERSKLLREGRKLKQ